MTKPGVVSAVQCLAAGLLAASAHGVTAGAATSVPVLGPLAHPAVVHRPAMPGHTSFQGMIPPGEESTNWSGYEDAGQGVEFTQVSASWTVPTLEANVTGSSSTWVGIDGTSTPDLIQAGTEQDWTISGPSYYAWYELLPGSAIELGDVHPGDRVTVKISKAAAAKWTISIDDATSGSDWSEQVAYSAAGTSAEWVVEAPSASATNSVEPLAAFGSVTFSGLTATGPGAANALAEPVYLVQQGDDLIEAYPGAYDGGGDSFTDYFGSPTGPLVTRAIPLDGSTNGATVGSAATPAGSGGYWLVGANGGIFSFGDARFYGSTGDLRLRQPVVAVAAAKNFGGYWLVAKDGGVFGFGGAPYLGSVPGLGIGPAGSKSGRHLASPVVAAAASTEGAGYYMVTASGTVFSFGSATSEGSCGGTHKCSASVSAIVPDRSGRGYWLVLSDCQVVAFGNAAKVGASDCEAYAKAKSVRAVAAATTPSGKGYWVVLANGAVFPEGDAKSLSTWQPPRPAASVGPSAVAIIPTVGGGGVWVVFADGQVTAYGDATQMGSASTAKLSAPIVAGAGW